MRLRLATLLVCAFALMAAPARADHGETVLDPTLARYMEIAASYWGGPEPVCTAPDGEVIRPHAVLGNDPSPNVAAWAEVGGCRIWLDTDYWSSTPNEQYCNLIAHEWGHLLGRGHSSDPKDLMWPQWTNNVVPGCAVFRAAPMKIPVRAAAPKPRLRTSKSGQPRRGCPSGWHRSRRLHRRWALHHVRHVHRHGCFRRLKAGASSSRLIGGEHSHGHAIEPGSVLIFPNYTFTMASISTSAPRGNEVTPMATRAGGSPGK
jgi:hypothetical protein